ncbi:MAG: hypothetical protein WC324_02380 [Candidatus Omnitrophota bacterium]|jgi:hypothetical protein|nr:hypothetical protein [bacterium]
MKRQVIITFFLIATTFSAFASDKVDEVLSKLSHAQEESDRVHIISFDLWNLDDPRIECELVKRLSSETTQEAYYVAQYLAKKGNKKALEILNRNNSGYPISSWQWSYTLKEFGRYKFVPAIPTLIESLDAASLNVVNEACKALQAFFPDSPATFQSLEEMKGYFMKRYNESKQVAPPVCFYMQALAPICR